MSFQYINPYIAQSVYCNSQALPYVQNISFVPCYAQNPFDASFYNQNLQYPYNNPLFQPNFSNNDYCYIKAITSPTGEKVHIYRLKNDQTVAIMPRKNQATIIKTFLDAGSMNETDSIRGISHMEEHMLFKGAQNLKDGDVFKLTGLMGASTNASTDYAQTDYYIQAPYFENNDYKKALEIQGDMITNPKNTAEALQSEKNAVCSEISMCNDNIYSMAFDKAIRNLFQIQSNSDDLVAGSIKTVQALTSGDLQRHHEIYYDPKDLYTVVVGDVDTAQTIDLISKNFTILPKNYQKHFEQINPIQNSKRIDIRSSKTNTTDVVLAFCGPRAIDAKDFVIADMVNYYLSQCSTSDLKKNLEKINAGYDFAYKKVSLNDTNPYALMSLITVNPNDEQKGIDIFWDSILNLQNNLISDEDLSALKKYMEKSKLISMQDSTQLCDLLGMSLMNNTQELFSQYTNIANSITKEDIRNFAKKYFDLNKVSMVVVHPTSVKEQDIKNNYEKSKYSLKQNPVSFCGSGDISTKDTQEYLMPNNTHLAINNSNSDLCVYSWSVDTPPIKPKNPNIPAVLAYMFQKGSEYKNQDEVERYKELNGIDAVVEVYGKSIDIYANCAPEDSQKTLELIKELLYHPKLTQSDFDTAKKFVKENLIASQKDAGSNLLDKIYPGFFPTKNQMLAQIDSLTLDDVKEFYRELLKHASSNFSATLPIQKYPQLKQQTIDFHQNQKIKFKEHIRKLTPIFQENPKTQIVVDTDDLNQAQIYKSYQFPLSGNVEDEAKFELLNAILGASANSRLFSDLRSNEHLAYSVSSNIKQFENTGVITLSIATTTDDKNSNVISFDNVEKSLKGFEKHTNLLKNELVSDEELKSAKMMLKQKLIGQFQNPLSKNDLILMNMQEPFGIKRIDKYLEAIDNVTKEDILNTAKFVFSYNPTISILASPDTIDSQMPYLKTQGEIVQA